MKTVSSVTALRQWAAGARKGDRVIYHVGDLASDAHPGASLGWRLFAQMREEARRLVDAGHVITAQRPRASTGKFRAFEYLAVKR